MKNVILFGASLFGKKVFNYYKDNKEINIIAFCDNDEKKHNSIFLDKKVLSIDSLMKTEYDEIIISSTYDYEIKEQLLKLGIKDNKIVFFQSNYEEIQLKNSNDLLVAEELMFNISDLLIKNNISYHIDHGTLLGIIRDTAIIPWDVDIDFAVPSFEKDKILKFLDNYLTTYKSEYCDVNKWKYTISYEDIELGDIKSKEAMLITIYNDLNKENAYEIGLDLALKYEYNNKFHWMVAKRKLSSSVEDSFPSKEIIFKNKILHIPCNEIKYLENLYGNWKIPIKKWHYSLYSNIEL